MKAHFTDEADRNLTQIVAYIAKDNPSAAFDWIDATRRLCELLTAQPGIGQSVRTRRFGNIRRHVSGNYLIYYREVDAGIEILLVSHGARDQDRLL